MGTKTLISSLPRHHNISMKLLVLVSSCIMVSNALPLIDYIYKGYEQAPYTVTADYNGIETRKYPEAWWACTEGSVAVTGDERVGSEWSLPGVINYMNIWNRRNEVMFHKRT